jgi:hypothetical protein
MPAPLELGVYAPANAVVPGEDLNFAWTMPMLTRMQLPEEVPKEFRGHSIKSLGTPTMRPTIDIVSFLPMPRAGAPPEEQFVTEFFVRITMDSNQLGDSTNYFGTIAKFGNRTIPQLVDKQELVVLADPHNSTMFSARMLISLSTEELARTPEDAGRLDIFVYRLTQNPYNKIVFSTTKGYDFGSIERGGSETMGYHPPPKLEVGDVSIGEGKKGEHIDTERLEDYELDPAFPIQQISIRLLGVREGSREALIQTLEQIQSGNVTNATSLAEFMARKKGSKA